MNEKVGILYIVATPIGNLDDLSVRAVKILKSVDAIAAEDTRHSRILLAHYDIHTPCFSFHEHNEARETQKIIERLKKGESIALISDAGTPLVSDPGERLVRLALVKQIRVVPIPGACAAIAALSVSSLSAERFTFEGFLPAKSRARRLYLTKLQNEERTMIFYEAPHRIIEMLADCIEIFGDDRSSFIARELTKQFETLFFGELKDVKNYIENTCYKGEFVVIIEGVLKVSEDDLSSEDIRIVSLVRKYLPANMAAKLAAEITGQKKNMLYREMIK